MSTQSHTARYNCLSDCRMAGCPGHDVTFKYHNTSDTFSYAVDDRPEEFIEVGLLTELVSACRLFGACSTTPSPHHPSVQP